jgi:glutaredoxin 3
MEKRMIEIYGKPSCPFCDKAKQLCEREGYSYEYKSLGQDYTTEQLFEVFPTARTFPQIRVDDINIGGYTELEAWHQGRIGAINT